MNHQRNSLIALLLFASAFRAGAGVLDYSTLPNTPAYEAAAEALREVPPSEYRFDQARLSDVLKLLADEAGMSFFSLPEESEAGERIVTFTIHASPFLAMETLAKANGIALIHENGIWYLRPENDTHLIGRVYNINYNPREMVKSQSNSGGLGAIGGGGASGGASGGGGGGISLPDTTNSFEVEPSRLLEDIRELLDIPSTTNVIFAGATSAEQFGSGVGGASQILLPPTLQGTAGANASGASIESSAKVIWNSDTNALYVVATRQQHQWIEGYLAAADKPQDQVAIEVKFFETTRDPRTEFGVDWTGTLGDGYGINLTGAGSTGATATTGTTTGTTTSTTASIGSGLSGPINLDRLGDYRLPMTGILSYEDVNVRIRALASDSNTKSVSYPRVVTTNNREVMIRSVINQPVLAASSSTSLGAGATQTQSVSYLPIGTVLNILPKQLGSGKIQLHVAITISSIIGETVIDGNPYPIASSRVYNAPVEVDSGYTVAIGGLDEATATQTESGIPLLRKIPGIGEAFKTRNDRRQRKRLMILITPTVIDAKDGGLPEEPQTALKVTPHDPAPPRIQPDGTIIANIEQLQGAIVSLRRECDLIAKELDDFTIEEIHKDRIEALLDSTMGTRAKLAGWAESTPGRARELAEYDGQLGVLEAELRRLKNQARWMRY